jgi:hypothetical protein
MEEDVVNLEIESAIMLPFQIGDYLDVYEKRYKLNKMPTVAKEGAKRFKYNVVFEGLQYDLINTVFLLGKDTMLDSLTADIDTFLDLIISNLDRIYSNLWEVGVIPASSATKNLTFGECNCLEALQLVCETYKTEFDITTVSGVNYINIREREVYFTTPFSIGKTGGLYKITRELSDTYPYITRMFVFGSSENLGNSYRHSRLCLSTKTKDTSYLQSSNSGVPMIEGIKIYDDIKPERTGTISTKVSELEFIDSSMNFDLSERWKKRAVMYSDGSSWYEDYGIWLVKKGLTDNIENQTIYDNDVYGTTKYLIGEECRISFQTGQLAGYEFALYKYGYEHADKRFRIVSFKDENGNEFPHPTNAAFQFRVGDKYIILNISMPDTYITDAETRLGTAAAADFAITEKPLYKYAIDISPLYIKILRAAASSAINLFTVGDYAKIIDTDFNVNAYFRIIEYKRNVLNINDINIVLSEKRGYNVMEAMYVDVRENKRAVYANKLNDPFRAQENYRSTGDVLNRVYASASYDKIDGVQIEIKDSGDVEYGGELYRDENNQVCVYVITQTIITDKDILEIPVGTTAVIEAYMNPNIAKENEIEATVTSNLKISIIEQYYDANFNLVFKFTVKGENISDSETLTLTSTYDNTVTKEIPVTVT